MCRNICCTRKIRHTTIISWHIKCFRDILTAMPTNVYFRPLLKWRRLFHWGASLANQRYRHTCTDMLAKHSFNYIYSYIFTLLFRSLRSSYTNLLTVPFARTTLGARSFSVASPKIWNSLPPALHSCNCPDTFRRHLKTHYFQQTFSRALLAPQIRHLLTLCTFMNFVYLLTYLLT